MKPLVSIRLAIWPVSRKRSSRARCRRAASLALLDLRSIAIAMIVLDHGIFQALTEIVLPLQVLPSQASVLNRGLNGRLTLGCIAPDSCKEMYIFQYTIDFPEL